MVNWFLTDVLGYEELKEIRTEYQTRGGYADYVVQFDRKEQFIVEVKSIEIDLNERHLSQSRAYAADEGIDWVLLFNGRQIQLYRVLFEKPIETIEVFSHDLSDAKDLRKAAEDIASLAKRSIKGGDLESLWRKSEALSPQNLVKLLNDEQISKYLRRSLRKKTGIYFDLREISEALHEAITEAREDELKEKKRKSRKKS